MISSLTNRQIRSRGFTLVELMVSVALCAVAGMILASVLVSTMSLSSVNAVTNLSSYRARQAIDHLNAVVRFAQTTPTLINDDGSTATGTTADGILVKNTLGGAYVFLNASGVATASIPSGASSFAVQYSAAASTSAPQVGDYFLLNISTQPELQVASVGTPTTSGSVSSVVITTTTGIAETVTPASYTIWASHYRKEAYIFQPVGTSSTLCYYPRVTAGMSYGASSNFVQLGSGFQKLDNQSWFTTTTDGSNQASWLRAVARSSNHAEFAETISGHKTLTTMPFQIKLWNYNAPPPSS